MICGPGQPTTETQVRGAGPAPLCASSQAIRGTHDCVAAGAPFCSRTANG